MMESNDNTTITDEQRAAAENKQISIEPLDPTVKPEEFSEEHVAAEHLRAPAVANAPNDVEQNTIPVQPTPSLVSPLASRKAPSLQYVRAGVVGAIVFLVALVAIVVLYTLG